MAGPRGGGPLKASLFIPKLQPVTQAVLNVQLLLILPDKQPQSAKQSLCHDKGYLR